MIRNNEGFLVPDGHQQNEGLADSAPDGFIPFFCFYIKQLYSL